MKYYGKKPYLKKERKFFSKNRLLFAFILIALAFVVRTLRPRKPPIIQSKQWPECVDIPRKQRRQYGVYNQILSQEKDSALVHLLPPDQIPVFNLSESSNSTTSPATPSLSTSKIIESEAQCTPPVVVSKKTHPGIQENKKEDTVIFQLRIGRGFRYEKNAQNALRLLNQKHPLPKGAKAEIRLVAEKDLLFIPFVWGSIGKNAFDAYIKGLKKNNVQYFLVKK